MRVTDLAISVLAAFAASANASLPADGLIDETWGLFDSGRSFVPFDENPANPLDIGRAAVADAQGRTYIVGTVITDDGPRAGITRLGSDGLIDTGYGIDGRVVSSYPFTGVAAALDGEGYLLVGGNRPFAGDDTDFALCRFDPDGNLAPFAGNPDGDFCVTVAFDVGGNDKDTLKDIALQPDGKIVLVGDASISDSLIYGAVARLNVDGLPDIPFGTIGGKEIVLDNGYSSHQFNAVVIASNGKLVLAGEAVGSNASHSDGLLVRLTATGLQDVSFGVGDGVATFNVGGQRDDVFHDLTLDPRGFDGEESIYAVGASETETDSGLYLGWVTRKLDTGNGDAFFGNSGNVLLNAGDTFTLRSIFREDNGNLVVAGSGSNAPNADSDFYAIRMNREGVIDNDFNAPIGAIAIDILQTGSQDTAYAMAMHRDRFVIAGTVLTTSPPPNLDFAAAALMRDGIFTNGVEEQD